LLAILRLSLIFARYDRGAIMNLIARFGPRAGRRRFLASTLATVGGAVVAGCWPSSQVAQDPDVDQQWLPPGEYLKVDPPGTPRPKAAALDLQQIIDKHGLAVVTAFHAQPEFRKAYYRLSRSWHVNWHKNGGCPGASGGEFGSQWCTLLEDPTYKLGFKGGSLTLDDFGNLHTYLFQFARTMVLQLTGHDIEPGNDDKCPPGNVTIFTFHNIPNDGSNSTWGGRDTGGTKLPFPP
jgi:hypothetical protein